MIACLLTSRELTCALDDSPDEREELLSSRYWLNDVPEKPEAAAAAAANRFFIYTRSSIQRRVKGMYVSLVCPDVKGTK